MTETDIHNLFDKFSHQHVLVVGDLMLDAYVWGKVNRISPEAPVPVLQVSGREERPGGAANVALNLSALGARVSVAGFVGDDAAGNMLLHLLEERQINTGCCARANRPTTTKTRMLSGSHHLLRIDEENDQDISGENAQRLIKNIATCLHNVNLIVLEDYDKGTLSPEIIKQVIAMANEQGIPVAVDPKFRHFMDFQGVYLFKPNLKELREGLKTEVNPLSESDMEGVTDELFAALGIENILITLSEHGIYYRNQATMGRIPAERRHIADVSGAGDTVIAIASLALHCGANLAEAAALANLGGGMVCETPGVVPIDVHQLLKESLKLRQK